MLSAVVVVVVRFNAHNDAGWRSNGQWLSETREANCAGGRVEGPSPNGGGGQ